MAKKSSRDAYYFAFGAKDWRSSESVRLMSMAEQGCFINLLSIAWLSSDEPCSIPSDDAAIAALLGIQVEEWKRYAPRVLAEFDDTSSGGRLRNEKLWEQYRTMRSEHRRRVQGGKTSALRERDERGRLLPSESQDSSKTPGADGPAGVAKIAPGSQSQSQSQLTTTTPAPAPKARSARPEPKYPHFSKEHCDDLHATWSRFGVVDYPIFRRTLGPVFEGPNAKQFSDVKVAMLEAISRAEKEARGEFLTLHSFVARVGYWIGEAKGRPADIDPDTGVLRSA